MKSLAKWFIALLVIIAPGCKKYLDVVPDNIATIDYAFKDKVRAEQYLFTCYSYMPRHGLPQYPGMFDDLTWSHSGVSWLPQLGYEILRDGNNVTSPKLNEWNGENGATHLWQGIRDCNIFMENLSKVRDLEEYEKKRWIAEAKFLKAYYHFFLLQMYGPIPIVKENMGIDSKPEEVAVFREPVDEVVAYIVQLLDEAVVDLPLRIEVEVSELGRITQPIAMAIKAKVLVTAASPLFNGNTDYASLIDKRGKLLFNQVKDPGKWATAAAACKQAIDKCHEAGISLYKLTDPSLRVSDSTRKVLTMSRIITDKWNVERIWGSGQYGNSRVLEEYTLPKLAPTHTFPRSVTVPTLKAAELFYSDKGVPISEDNTYDYNNRYGLTTTTQADRYYMQPGVVTARLHLNREPRFYGSLGVDGGWWFGLGRMDENQQWPLNVKIGDESGRSGIERFSVSGFFIKKLSNFQSAYNNTTYLDKRWDFPVFRLADLYLLYAEALNETKNAPDAEVYQYIDLVRERSGLEGVVQSWQQYSKFPQKCTSKEGMRSIIQTERSIELAFEGHRLWDLRRWKTAIEAFSEPVRGWNIEGTDYNEFYKVRIVNQLNYTLRDIFWPIKQREVSVNRNLVQNLGW